MLSIELTTVRIAQAARSLGYSSATLIRLERLGRIPPAQRDHSGHRRYTPQDVERIRAVLFGGHFERRT